MIDFFIALLSISALMLYVYAIISEYHINGLIVAILTFMCPPWAIYRGIWIALH